MNAKGAKPVWVVLVVMALLVAGFGWWGSHRVRRAMQEDLRQQLRTVLNANVTALEIWMTNQEKLATSIADDAQVRQLALELLDAAGSGTPDMGRLTNLAQQSSIARHLQSRLRAVGYGTAELVTTNLMIIGGVGPRAIRVGRPVLEDHVAKFSELFTNGQAIVITPFKPRLFFPSRGMRGERRPAGERGFAGVGAPMPQNRRMAGERGRGRGAAPGPGEFRPMLNRGRLGDVALMQVAAPIRDAGGHIRGALTLIINPDLEFSRILAVARQGESGETYAFDQDGLMISRSRFDDQLKKLGLLADRAGASSALTLELRDPGGDLTAGFRTNELATHGLIASVANAVKGGSDVTVEPFRDYRGVPVVGAWQWLPDQGFGVAAQMDAAEAYRPLRILQRCLRHPGVAAAPVRHRHVRLFLPGHVVAPAPDQEAELKAPATRPIPARGEDRRRRHGRRL